MKIKASTKDAERMMSCLVYKKFDEFHSLFYGFKDINLDRYKEIVAASKKFEKYVKKYEKIKARLDAENAAEAEKAREKELAEQAESSDITEGLTFDE